MNDNGIAIVSHKFTLAIEHFDARLKVIQDIKTKRVELVGCEIHPNLLKLMQVTNGIIQSLITGEKEEL